MNFSSKSPDEIMQKRFSNMKSDNLTVRDYIAIKAMQGLMSTPIWPVTGDFKDLAELSYQMSDAMIKESSK